MASYAQSYRGSNWSGRGKGPAFSRRSVQNVAPGSFQEFKRRLRDFPITLAAEIAAKAAPAITAEARSSFAAGETVYGDPRPIGHSGTVLSLRKTGATERTIKFVSNGRIVRCVLGTKYAKYLIGKYTILPNGSAAIPSGWERKLDEIVNSMAVAP